MRGCALVRLPARGAAGLSHQCAWERPSADSHVFLQDHHVLVMTPQLLLNLLDAGEAHMDQISLLVSASGGTAFLKDSVRGRSGCSMHGAH